LNESTVGVLVAALKDSHVTESLKRALLPSIGLQIAIQTAVESRTVELEARLDEQIQWSKKLQAENELLWGRNEGLESYNRLDTSMIYSYSVPENVAETVASSVTNDDENGNDCKQKRTILQHICI
jgi:hypothetical protein